MDAVRGVVHPGDTSGRRVSLPIYQVLVEAGGQRILVDTGLPPVAAGDSDALKREFDIDPLWIRPVVRSEQSLQRQLATLGLYPDDIDLVIASHLHFDHAGGNALFQGIPIAVQRVEMEAALEDDYLSVWDAPGVIFNSVEGDWSPVPGVELLHTPGHTPGHQSLLLRIAEQPWLFTFDAVYTEEHWRERRLGAVRDIPPARQTLKRLRALAAKERAGLVFGHDLAQWESLHTGDLSRPIAISGW
jgi:N-acyl homoserine lactone hydrolase